MRATKYPFEIWVSPLPFWYLTPSQISDGTASNLNFLTVARGQDRIDVVIENFCLEVLLLDWALILASYGASKISAPIHNLATYPCILFVMVPYLVITFPSTTMSQVDFLVDLFSFELCMRIITSIWLNLISGEIWWVHYPETFHVILLFETLPTYHLERAFPRLLLV
jgi:hypothetical protein